MYSLLIIISIFGVGTMILLAFLTWNKSTRLFSAILIPVLCFAVYKGYDAINELKGAPTANLPTGKWILISSFQDPPNHIYLLIQLLDRDEPLYVVIPWKKDEGQEVSDATEEGKNGKIKVGEFKKSPRSSNQEYDKLEMYDFNLQDIIKK